MNTLRITRTPKLLAFMLTRALDAVAILTLVSTEEMNQQWALLILCVAIAAYLLRVREVFSKNFLFFLMATVVIGSIVLWPRFRLHPLVVAAHAAPLMHSLLWFSRAGATQFHSRLALGFLQVALAAALSPDLSVGVGIFVFFVTASLQLTALHLWGDFQKHSPVDCHRPIPKRVLVLSTTLALLTLSASLLIFPFLPRIQSPWSHSRWDKNASGTELGYSEQVGLGLSLKWFKGTGQSESEPVLRIFLPDISPSLSAEEIPFFFPQRLLKMRVLDHWTGDRWVPTSKPEIQMPFEAAAEKSRTLMFKLIREPLPTESLPNPYSTQMARLVSGSSQKFLPSQGEGLLRRRGFQERRISYELELNSHQVSTKGLAPPTPEDSWIPTQPSSLIQDLQRWESLSKRIFKVRTSTVREKLRELQSFFVTAGFKGGLEDFDPSTQGVALDRFLFQSRKGHCEWFATSSLLLLRLAGVPARLVSGFLISEPPFGGVLTVQHRDAHLWLEVWDNRGKHWIPFDPTPQSARVQNLWGRTLGWLRNLRHWASSYWYKWILTPDESSKSALSKRLNPFAGVEISWKSLRNPSQSWQLLSERIVSIARSVRDVFKHNHALFLGVVTVIGVILISLGLKLIRSIEAAHWSHRSLRLTVRKLRFFILPRALRAYLEARYESLLLRIRFSGMTRQSRDFEDTLQEIDRLFKTRLGQRKS